MPYVLIGSQKSPFVRICRILMIQHQVDCEFQVLNFVDDRAAAEALERQTPVNKVPILLDGAQTVLDSRVIVSYLGKRHGFPELTADEENLVTAIYACLDSSVILFLMKRDGFDIDTPGFFLRRHRQRIVTSLAFVAPWASGLDPQKPRDWNYASVALYSYLDWAEKRAGLLDLQTMPEMSEFMSRFANAPGVRETAF